MFRVSRGLPGCPWAGGALLHRVLPGCVGFLIAPLLIGSVERAGRLLAVLTALGEPLVHVPGKGKSSGTLSPGRGISEAELAGRYRQARGCPVRQQSLSPSGGSKRAWGKARPALPALPSPSACPWAALPKRGSLVASGAQTRSGRQ